VFPGSLSFFLRKLSVTIDEPSLLGKIQVTFQVEIHGTFTHFFFGLYTSHDLSKKKCVHRWLGGDCFNCEVVGGVVLMPSFT
jgi:hypothetical protein